MHACINILLNSVDANNDPLTSRLNCVVRFYVGLLFAVFMPSIFFPLLCSFPLPFLFPCCASSPCCASPFCSSFSQQGTSSCRSVNIAKLATRLHMSECLGSWLHLDTSRHVSRRNDGLPLALGDTPTSLCLEKWLSYSVQLNSETPGESSVLTQIHRMHFQVGHFQTA